MLGFEKRWAQVVLEAFLGERSSEGLPSSSVDWQASMQAVRRACMPQVAHALRLGVWLITWSPCWLLHRACRFGSLPMHERSQLLERLLNHRSFILRECTGLLKLTASIALLGDATVRAASGYDRRRDSSPWSAPEHSETRPKRHLATAVEAKHGG